jgi:uncharacterized protein (DUF1778 family)
MSAAPGVNGNGNGATNLSVAPSTLAALEAAAKAQGKTLAEFLADAAKPVAAAK